MIFLCPFLHCKALRIAMSKCYINSIIIIIIIYSVKKGGSVGNALPLPHAKMLLVPMNCFLWLVDNALDENVLTEQMWIFAAYFILRDHDTHIDFLPLLKCKALHFAVDFFKVLLACENIRFSFLFAAGDVSRGGTSATQQRKFHTDDANQCLHNKSGSHGVPNINLSNFTCLLVDFGKVLCSSANELQQNSNASSREDYIPQILTVLLEILRVYIWPLWPFVFCLSFVNNS